MGLDFLYEPAQAERTVSIHYGKSPNPLKKTTINHVAAGGLPVNAIHLKHVRESLMAGDYESDRDALIQDIKYDPGLFVYCIRQARILAGKLEHPFDIFSELRNLPHDQLQQLLDVNRQTISRHILTHSNSAQAVAQQHLLLCIAAIEVLAPRLKVDRDAAYTVSVFRELGDALLVWNYPELYSRILSNHRRFGSDIDSEWIRLLGTTPHKIGMTLADDLRLPSNVRFAFQQHGEHGSSIREVTEGEVPALHALSGLADIYAQMHDPAHYPDGRKLWLAEQETIEKIFGDHLVEDIDAQVTEIFSLYAEEVPGLEKFPFVHSSHRGTHGNRETTRIQINSYVKRCPESLQKIFKHVYDCIGTDAKSTTATQLFTEELVPQCGFARGCLYVLDSHDGMLKPTLPVGELPLEHYASLLVHAENEFSAFLNNGIPYHSTTRDGSGRNVDRIVGGLKNNHHPGVLYLELASSLINDSDADPLLLFQALRATLDDIRATPEFFVKNELTPRTPRI